MQEGKRCPADPEKRGISDITDAEEKLGVIDRELHESREQVRFLSSVLEDASIPFIAIRPNGCILTCNKALSQLTGYSKDELNYLHWIDLTAPNWRATTLDMLEKLRLTGKPQKHEKEYARKDGSTVPVEVFIHHTLDEQGHLEYYYAFITDLTERKSAEKAHRICAAIVNSTLDSIVGWAPDGSILSWNRGAEEIYGYTACEILNHSIQTIVPPDRFGEIPRLVDMVYHGESVRGYETKRVTKAGRTIDVSLTLSPLIGDEGQVQGVSDISRDITQAKKADKELRETREQAELCLDLLSHDIGNKNQILMGYLELALESIRLTEEQRALIETPIEVLRESTRLVESVKNIQQARRCAIAVELIDLGQVLEAAKEKYSHYQGRDITLNYSPQPGCIVRGNRLLETVFNSILENAVLHSDPGKPLTVNIGLARVLEGNQNYCKVWIEDSGPGIPDAQKSKLFSRKDILEEKTRSRGISLIIVMLIVEDFRGKVWVEDRVPGDYRQGSRFVVLLPAIEK